jgi:hypothetical protein
VTLELLELAVRQVSFDEPTFPIAA